MKVTLYIAVGITLIVGAYFSGRHIAFREAHRWNMEVSYIKRSNYLKRDLELLREIRESGQEQSVKSLEMWVSYQLPHYNEYFDWVDGDVDPVTRDAMASLLKYEAEHPGAIDTKVPNLSVSVVQHLAGVEQ